MSKDERTRRKEKFLSTTTERRKKKFSASGHRQFVSIDGI
jgi:hypothetical protein